MRPMTDLALVLLVILALALLWRGPKTLPKLGEALGRGVREVRREVADLHGETGTAEAAGTTRPIAPSEPARTTGPTRSSGPAEASEPTRSSAPADAPAPTGTAEGGPRESA
jgi:Sec-independent protein translocase protein TatA